MFAATHKNDRTATVQVIRGRAAILEMGPVLEELAMLCGQPGSMSWLSYFLGTARAAPKPAYLVLILHEAPVQDRVLQASDIRAAALFFEYRVMGWSTSALTTDDVTGFRTVIAVESERPSMTAAAVRALLEQGAHIVLATCGGPMVDKEVARDLTSLRGIEWARRERHLKKTLPLGANLEETLSTLSKSARFKLRYYRRKLEKGMPCELVENVRDVLSDAELATLNAESLNPVTPEEFRLRVTNASAPGGFLLGLKTSDGRWLALVGGWRQADLTVMHWQLNRAGFEKDSIGTVMRSFFLEHEIAIGMSRLMIYGGTPHSMRHAFQPETVSDLVVRRRSWRALLLRSLAPLVASTRGPVGRGNFLAQTLCSNELHWLRTGSRWARWSGASANGVSRQRGFGAANGIK